ncbi:MAG: TetR/AcrR family transcriptional regulator [Candidatus Kapabacteria bacterium]|nr:TetR/AcrR family transcriptional regulator [Candidatus Kapabacteria bacterium]
MNEIDQVKELKAKQRILDGATEVFLQYGYSKVTMDEIAHNLGVSKKTIYKFFKSKEELLTEVMKFRHNCMQNIIEPIYKEECSFIEKMVKVGYVVSDMITKTPINFLHDIERNAPIVFKNFKKMKNANMEVSVGEFIRIGKESSFFRDDIPSEVMVSIYSNIMDTMFKAELYIDKTYTPTQMYDFIIRIFFEGVMTENGRKEYFEKKDELKQIHNNNFNIKNN